MIMLDQLGHMQAPTAVSLLSALLEHPKVQEGLCDGYKAFEEFYEPAPLTEEEMIDEVEQNLSRRITERCKKLCLYEGWEPTSYFYNLGFVLGTSSKGLIYAHASAAAPHEQSKEAVTCH